MSQSTSTESKYQPAPATPPASRWRRWLPGQRGWALLLGGAATVGVGVLLFRPAAVPVDWATVAQADLEVVVTAEGQTRVRDRFVIAASVAGRLQRIDLEVGDRVAAGQVVARLDPLPLNAEVASLQARIQELQAQRRGVATQRPKPEALRGAAAEVQALNAARAEAAARVTAAAAALEQVQRDRQRAETLFADGAIARQELETAKLTVTRQQQALTVARQEVERIEAEIAAAQAARQRLQAEQRDPDYLLDAYTAQIRSLEAQLASQVDAARRTDIRADRAGQVLRLLEESERFVSAGTPLLELGNPGELELVADVLSSEAVQVDAGDPVRIDQWGGDRPLVGQVRTVEPAAFTEVSALGVDEQRVNVVVDLENVPANLGDGYRAEAEIVVWRGTDVLTVPIGALFRCESAWCVFVAAGDRARRQPVSLGRRNQQQAEITEGLQAGDRVILHPSDAVRDGVRVRSRDAEE